MRSFVVLFVWLLGVLFPFVWLGRFSKAYQNMFDLIFGPEWMHIIMHVILYAVLGILLSIAFRLRLHKQTVLSIGLIILGIGILQESMQLLSLGLVFPQPIALARGCFDLGVDLVGGLLGLFVLQQLRISFRLSKCDQTYH
jgi:hypothetical protein